ncbi:MAG: hypothetical protein ACKOAD_00170, partial [Gammaproteobacteria bacterium]
MIQDFTRGSQISMHSVRMFIQAIKYTGLLIVLLFGLTFIVAFFKKTNSYDRYILKEYIFAQIDTVLSGEKSTT